MNQNFRRVLLRKDQAEMLERMQEQERRQSSHSITPSIHAIARAVFDRAMQEQKL